MSKWLGKKLAKAFAPTIKHLYATQGALCKAFYERYGEEAIPIIAEVMSKAGVEHGKISQRGLRGKGMKAFGGQLEMMETIMGMKVEIIELSDDMIHYKHSECPLYGLEGTSRELCEAIKTGDKKMLSTALGQEVEAKVLKSVADGDEYCEVIFSIKK